MADIVGQSLRNSLINCIRCKDYNLKLITRSHLFPSRNIIQPRTIDLFCGGGGSSWGAKNAGAKIIGGVDAWSIATQTYAANFPGARVVNTRLDNDSDPSIFSGLGGIDLLLASPECTNHTCAKGSRPRDDASKRTAHYVTNFAKHLNPRWVVLENVIFMRNWDEYNPLIADLEALGYNVSPQILDSADFGVPQSRRRLFLLCDRDRKPSPVVPSTCPAGTIAKDILIQDGNWKSRPLYLPNRANRTLASAELAMDALGKGVPFLIVYYGSGGWQSLDRPIRTITTLDRFGLVTWNGDIPMLRMLQVPELRRAMGFEDDFQMPFGSRRDRVRLLGNGVCPPVMSAIVHSLTRQQAITLAA